MKAFLLAFLTVVGMAAAASAQDHSDTEGLRNSLTEMLSLLSFGFVAVPDQAVQVTQAGADLRLRLPLDGFIAPSGAAAEAVARSAGKGAWDIASMTLPAAGAVGSSIDNVVSYTIGQQATRGRLFPRLTAPSTLVSALRAITLSTAGDDNSEQSIEGVTLDSMLSGRSDRRVDLRVQDGATNWHVRTRDPNGLRSDSMVREVAGRWAVTGLDRAQGSRFMAATRSLMRTANASGHLSIGGRADLRAMLDASAGLSTRIDANQTLDGLRIDLGRGNAGTLGRLRLHVEGAAEEQLLNAAGELAMDEPTVAALSADRAAFLPHHLAARLILAGIPLQRLTTLLQAALATDPDRLALQQQAVVLLNTPGAKAAIESIAFDSGPVRVCGSARLQPRDDGEVGASIHLAASGLDAALAQLQTAPNIQGVMPLIFLAKGLGRAEGDSIVWDILLGGGPPVVNGMPIGQSAPRTR